VVEWKKKESIKKVSLRMEIGKNTWSITTNDPEERRCKKGYSLERKNNQ